MPFPFRRQINIGLNKLKKDPRPKLCERIDEGENYRLRISGWRVVYVIDDDALTITIVAIVTTGRETTSKSFHSQLRNRRGPSRPSSL